jgi:hypothetical protein
MDPFLSHLINETKYTNQDRIRIFKEVISPDLTDMKISKSLKPYFIVSSVRVDKKNKRNLK